MQKKIKIYLSLFVTLCISIQFFSFGKVEAIEKQTQTFYNVVYFACFADGDNNFVENNSYTEQTFKLFNDTTYEKSLKSYIDTISYGQLNVESNFPQYNGTKITPYQLKGSQSDYSNDMFVDEIVKNVSVSDDIPLDGNNDGIVDNVIIIMEGSSDDRSDGLWPHKSTFGGGTLNGKDLGTYNVHNTSNFYDSLNKSGVLAHEFLHSIGYPDLYRNDNGVPVGSWDIMASSSVFCQYPLAYLRSKISDWLDISEISNNASLTLNPASSDSGNRAYILKTPLSDTECFVVEYRKQGEKYTNQLDTKIYGTGLVVYRIVEGNGYDNLNSNDYGVYVFRPNETGLRDGAGDMSQSFLSAESGRTSIGSTDFSATIQDGALVYSDGTNSGIKINNVGSAGDTISFDVEFADTSNLGVWSTLGNQNIIDDYASDAKMVATGDNELYVVYNGEYGSNYKTSFFDGSQWKSVGGTSLSDVSYNIKLTSVNNVPYLLYNDNDFKPVLKKYDIATDKWITIKTFSNELAQYISLASYGDKIYVAYTKTSSNFTYALDISEYNVTTGQTTELGNISSNAVNIEMSACSDGLYVAYRDMSVNDVVEVQHFDGTGWTKLTSLNKFGNPLSIKAIANDKVYFAFDDSGAEIYCYNGLEWQQIGEKQSNASILELDIAVYNDTPYIAYNTQTANQIIGLKYENGEWSNEGMRINDKLADYMNFTINNGTAYVVYGSETQKPLVKYKTLGDSQNYDISIKEIKEQVLGIKEVSENSDINKDKKIDVFDVLKAKQLKQ